MVLQFENELHPDVDDSAVVIMALSKLKIPGHEGELNESILVGSDGSWRCKDPTAVGCLR